MNDDNVWYSTILFCVLAYGTCLQGGRSVNDLPVPPLSFKGANYKIPDNVARVRTIHKGLAEAFPHNEKAIQNGEHIIQLFNQEEAITKNQLRFWQGKVAAFECSSSPPHMIITSHVQPLRRINLNVALTSDLNQHPIIAGCCVLGTIRYIDLKTKTIFIKVNNKNFRIHATG